MAFVYDPADDFELKLNPDTIHYQRLGAAHWERALLALIEEHAREASSRYAAMLLHDWEQERHRFWHIVPKEFLRYLPVPLDDAVLKRA
jgi:glutamate synthase (NADPH/NADH) large chain